MPRERSFAARIFSIVVFILLEAAALFSLSRNNELQRLSLARISHGFMAKTWGASQTVREYFSLKKRNDELALENSRLWEETRAYESRLAAADSSLRPYLKDDGFKYIPATIVKTSSNTQRNYLIIDKGSDDGIVEDAGIVTPKGVVGIVDAVSKHYSYAISFLNSEVNISARLGDEGAVGPLTWNGMSSDEAVLKEIPLQYKFAPGDTVFTSGYSTIFPPGIPLGVAGEYKIINGATNEIEVKLFQDQTALRYVTVIENTRAGEIEAIEHQNEERKK